MSCGWPYCWREVQCQQSALNVKCYRSGVVGWFLSEVTPAPGAANAKRQPFFGFRPLSSSWRLWSWHMMRLRPAVSYTSTQGGPVHRARHIPTDSRAKSSSASATGCLRSCGAGSDAVSLLWLPHNNGRATDVTCCRRCYRGDTGPGAERHPGD